MASAPSRTSTLADRLLQRASGDGEFRLCARHWSGSLSIDIGDHTLSFVLVEGNIALADRGAATGPGHIGLAASGEVWEKILAPVPPPFFNDIMPARAFGLVLSGEDETVWQYYPAVRRLIDLLREEWNSNGPL